MSIFSDHISDSGDKIVEQYYNIVWDKSHPKNVAYRDSLPQPDSLRINETKDTIWMYEGDKCFVLNKEINDEK